MLKTGLTMGGQVRRQGEIVKLTANMPVSIADQRKQFNKGAWYVEVGSIEEETILDVGMPSERDVFSTDQVIKPGFAAPDETPSDVKVEQVGEQPTDEEIEASMELKSVVEDEEEESEEDSGSDEISLKEMTREELRAVIDDEDLDVSYNAKTTKDNLISGIENARDE